MILLSGNLVCIFSVEKFCQTFFIIEVSVLFPPLSTLDSLFALNFKSFYSNGCVSLHIFCLVYSVYCLSVFESSCHLFFPIQIFCILFLFYF